MAWITAKELMERQQADPVYQAAMAERRRKDEEEAAEERRILAPLIQDVQKAGFPEVESVTDMLRTDFDQTPLLPLLLDHLKRDYPFRPKWGITLLFGTKKALFAWNDLVELFKERIPEGLDGLHLYKTGLAAALAEMADKKHAPELVGLVEDKGNGPFRVMFLPEIMRYVPDAPQLLEKWLDDPELAPEAEYRLKLYRKRMAKKAKKEAEAKKGR
ncbi:MAG: hypothetical protein FWE94_03515 [Coriobacteriia bacterium]|nr:hypothetical protein [Coriobacteriia bacterium]